ncbi:YigZ family protein [Syntrophotalea acetylenivorans]|uniref:YigZ family protein n=1 Tax=Syntrophotalea acetylenivorans TaxID=1842532 RepID=A0A1L3GPQ7_9BACT|nr:YigZ family protein [Syntrophotalea acetylenivorans]APG27931.1 YigZ family protein [Syntrophotalea acetylenivorans]
MSKSVSYLIPVGAVCVEQEVKRSRFIARLGRAADRPAAMDFLHTARRADSLAQHHCWAFIAGNPAKSDVLGMSDDGEPAGTAGRPILSALQYSGLGEIVAVVSRYFGGIKLGTGGLVRAYSGAVQQALGELIKEPFVERIDNLISLPFALEDPVRRLLSELQVDITQADYSHEVTLTVAIASGQLVELEERLSNCCQGRFRMRRAKQTTIDNSGS